jgi:hypothetical protein
MKRYADVFLRRDDDGVWQAWAQVRDASGWFVYGWAASKPDAAMTNLQKAAANRSVTLVWRGRVPEAA